MMPRAGFAARHGNEHTFPILRLLSCAAVASRALRCPCLGRNHRTRSGETHEPADIEPARSPAQQRHQAYTRVSSACKGKLLLSSNSPDACRLCLHASVRPARIHHCSCLRDRPSECRWIFSAYFPVFSDSLAELQPLLSREMSLNDRETQSEVKPYS